jgi:M6 family metalloprotease-like protein
MKRRLFIFVTSLIWQVAAIAPPHPEAVRSTHVRHRELKGSFNWNNETILVNAALCQDLSHDECFKLNESFNRKARKLNKVYQTNGRLKVLVLCVRFSNHADRVLPTSEQLNVLFNGPAPNQDLAPIGSAKQFISENSYGSLDIDFVVMPWKTTDNNESYYSFNISGITRDLGNMMHPVLDQLEQDGVDFSDFDGDDDGKIDATIMLHSGYQAEIGNFDCYSGATFQHRIWSHAILVPLNPWNSKLSSMSIDNYAVASALRGICDSKIARLGVIVHEFLHLFGLPDLYDVSGEYIGHGLGHYSIMSNRKLSWW